VTGLFSAAVTAAVPPAPPSPAPVPAPSACGPARAAQHACVPPPAGSSFRLAASSEDRAGTALVGQAVLYRWPVDGSGWVRGTVAAARSRAAGFSHVVRPGSTAAHPSPPSGRRWCTRCSTRPRTARAAGLIQCAHVCG
jgi:hypothetical protein